MHAKLDSWTVVLAGAWNTSIFSPPWVGKHLFSGEKELGMEAGMVPNAHFFRYRAQGILVIPKDDRLIIGATAPQNEVLDQMEQAACKTLKLLPHTPLVGVGINFGSVEESPSEELLTLFDMNDLGRLSNTGSEVIGVELNRQLRVESDILNVKHVLRDGVVEIHLNFHYDTDSTDKAREYLGGRVCSKRECATKFLTDVYDLMVEEEETHDIQR